MYGKFWSERRRGLTKEEKGRKECLPDLQVLITFVSRFFSDSSMSDSLFLQKSAAFWPPWPSKIAKHALADDPLKPSLTENYSERAKIRICRHLSEAEEIGGNKRCARPTDAVQILFHLPSYFGLCGKCVIDETDVIWRIATYSVFLGLPVLRLSDRDAEPLALDGLIRL